MDGRGARSAASLSYDLQCFYGDIEGAGSSAPPSPMEQFSTQLARVWPFDVTTKSRTIKMPKLQ
jgi:hypothetical protein